MSTLISLLEPGALARLIASGSDAERERFTAAATAALTPEAVVDVMDAAASATRRTISPHLLRLFRKLRHVLSPATRAPTPLGIAAQYAASGVTPHPSSPRGAWTTRTRRSTPACSR